MVVYSKEAYKEHYGKIYLPLMLIGIGIVITIAIALCIIVIPLLESLAMQEIGTPGYLCVSVVVLFAIAIIIYAKHKTITRAKSIKIMMADNEHLYIEDKVKSGLSFSITNPVEQIVEQYYIPFYNITAWKKDNRYYYLDGLFEPISVIDGIPYKVKDVTTRIRIPRCFLEEQTLDTLLDNICGYNVYTVAV